MAVVVGVIVVVVVFLFVVVVVVVVKVAVVVVVVLLSDGVGALVVRVFVQADIISFTPGVVIALEDADDRTVHKQHGICEYARNHCNSYGFRHMQDLQDDEHHQR